MGMSPRLQKLLTRLANLALAAGACACLLVLAYALLRARYWPPGTMHKYYLLSAAGLAACAAAFRLRPAMKINAALAGASLLASLYLAEIVLVFQRPYDRVRVARKLGVPFDTRTRFQVMQDLRRRGVAAYPFVPPSLFISTNGLQGERGRLFPLGGISEKTTIMGNESGRWIVYQSDEHGFNNPRGAFAAKRTDVVLVGDSFTQGLCVPPGKDLASRLRARGWSVVSLGAEGAGPLMELGAVTEYARALKPRVVLWMYYEGNDLADLSLEKTAPLLQKYLDAGFSQGLIRRQAEIDRVLTAYVDAQAASQAAHPQAPAAAGAWPVKKTLMLWHLRGALGLHRLPQAPASPAESPRLRQVLAEAKRRVASWGGRLVFVWLPCWERFSSGAARDESFRRRGEVLSLVRGLGLPVIDVLRVFNAHPDPLSLFPLRIAGHYTEEGYRLAADAIARRLVRERFVRP